MNIIAQSAAPPWVPTDPTSAFLVNKGASDQNFTDANATKVTWGTEEFDVGAEFASNSFVAAAAGKYAFDCAARVTAMGTGTTSVRLMLYKNGSLYKALENLIAVSGLTDITLRGAVGCMSLAIADSIDIYVQFVGLSAGTATIEGDATESYFSGVRL